MSMKWVRALSRTFSAIMVTSLLVLTIAIPAVSAATPEVSVGDVTLQGDGTVSVQVLLRDFSDLGSVDFRLHFDQTIAEVVSVQAGNLPGGTYNSLTFDNAAGWAYCGWATGAADGPIGDFTLCTVTFAPLATGGPSTFTKDTNPGYYEFQTTEDADIGPTFTLGDLEVEAPEVVWVDKLYTDAAHDGGHIWDYNAFDTIQEGIDAVSASTVHVAAGTYGAFKIDTKNGVNVLGAGPTSTVINTFVNPDGPTQNAMAWVYTSDNVVLDGLGFAAAPSSTGDSAIHIYDSDDCEVKNVTVDGIKFDSPSANDGYGIEVGSAPSSSASITNTTITNCNVGVSVISGSSATIDNCTITGGGTGASYDSTGVYVSGVSTTTSSNAVITNSTIQDCSYGVSPPSPEPGIVDTSRVGCGVYVSCDTGLLVTIGGDGCADGCDILNNRIGILAVYGNSLTCNYSSIVGNYPYGVYVANTPAADCEYNWWGADDGPSHSPGSGDPVSDYVDFNPWLDGPCPNGDPIGIDAKFRAAGGGKPGEAVKFTDLSTPPPGCVIDRWEWDLDGDGMIDSTKQNPSFVYYRAGSYTVTLTVYSDDCEGEPFRDSYTLTITIVKESDKDRVEDAKMSVAYLNIDPLQVLPNQEVIVSANVCNQGGERGTKTVALMVNGNAEQSQTVSVSPGACQQVTFRVSRAVPGTYQVAVDGMVGQFSVLGTRTVTRNVPTEQETGIGTAGIIAIVVVIIVLIVGLVVIFKKE